MDKNISKPILKSSIFMNKKYLGYALLIMAYLSFLVIEPVPALWFIAALCFSAILNYCFSENPSKKNN